MGLSRSFCAAPRAHGILSTYGLTFIRAASESFLSGKITIHSCLLAILRDVEKIRLAMGDEKKAVFRMPNIDTALIASTPIRHLARGRSGVVFDAEPLPL